MQVLSPPHKATQTEVTDFLQMSILRTKPCKECSSEWHTRMSCPYRQKKTLVTRRPMNKIGRVGKETARAVAKWKKTQQSNHEGYYRCYICGKWITYLMAEHVKSKVRRPDLRTDPNNLKPTCAECNKAKGSHSN